MRLRKYKLLRVWPNKYHGPPQVSDSPETLVLTKDGWFSPWRLGSDSGWFIGYEQGDEVSKVDMPPTKPGVYEREYVQVVSCVEWED